MESQTAAEKSIPPYIPYEKFTETIDHFKKTIVPPRIDKSALPPDMPGLTRGQVTSAFRFLGLINGAKETQEPLHKLVAAHGTSEWGMCLKEILEVAYSSIIGDLDLKTATPHLLDECFGRAGVDGQMLSKSIRFYLSSLGAAGVSFSPLLTGRRKVTPNQRRKNTPSPAKANGNGQAAGRKSAAEKETKPQTDLEGTKRFPVFFKGKPDGAIIVPEDLSVSDVKVLELTLAVVKAYADQSVDDKTE